MSLYIYYCDIDKAKSKIYCPIESCIVLALLKYTKSFDKVKLTFVKQCKSCPSIAVDIQDIMEYSVTEALEVPVKYCQLPVYYDNNFYCVAGLCSVLRQIIQADDNFTQMLGFRQNCLSGCAEQSSWTKFCEVDSMECVEHFLIGNNKWIPHIQHLELKLKQPLKIHNKGTPKSSKEDVTRYVESTQFSLSDFILVLCVHFVFINTSDVLFSNLPHVKKWYTAITSDSALFTITSMFSISISSEQKKQSILSMQDLSCQVKPQVMSKSQKARKFSARAEDAQHFVNTITPRIKQHGFGYGHAMQIDLEDIPYFALPEAGDLPQERNERKCQQLVSMTKAVIQICSPNDVIVDFCSGGGHLGLLIAHLVPQCRVVLLDNKLQSLSRAQHRAKELSLTNLYIVQSNVDYFIGDFDIGICLHACGVASDLVMQKCVLYNASMVVSPCCYGKIQTCHTCHYPRSAWLQSLGITPQDHHLMSHCADRLSPEWMNWIDADRLEWARENGYHVFLGKLEPVTCTPKNNMLVASKTKELLSEENTNLLLGESKNLLQETSKNSIPKERSSPNEEESTNLLSGKIKNLILEESRNLIPKENSPSNNSIHGETCASKHCLPEESKNLVPDEVHSSL
uniref:Glutathione S-transferase C-terminal domain-containing protein homolog n=1 Tax=Cacopsylla melanoneura TaxID=428564 RepID=A0A8D9AQ21_9HEMI